MNHNAVNLIMLIIMLMMMFSAFNYFISLLFSKIGLGVIFLIWFLYQIYKFKNYNYSVRSKTSSYYDHINTYTPGNDFEYRRNTGTNQKGILASIKEWFREKKRLYYYAKFKKTWERIQKKYALDMRCPYCGSDITVFNVSQDARCNYCGNKLL